MTNKEQDATLSPATVAALARVYSQALDGSATYDQAIADAEQAGKTELAKYLRDVQGQDQARITKGQQLIGSLGDGRGNGLQSH